MESGFELLLFRLYTDKPFREAVRRDIPTYGQRYNLSEQEVAALTNMDWGAFAEDAWALPGPDDTRCGGGGCRS